MLQGGGGLPLVGETLSFLRDPISFVRVRVHRYGTLFRSNILACPTVFACSYETVMDVLVPRVPCTINAASTYNEFLAQLYPPKNILLLEADSELRAALLQKFGDAVQQPKLNSYRPLVQRLTADSVQSLLDQCTNDGTVSVALYPYFKNLCEVIVTSLVLGELSREQLATVRQLCSYHFQAVGAMPVSISVLGKQNAQARALSARDKLLAIINNRIAEQIANVSDSSGEISRNPTLLANLVQAIGGKESSASDRELLSAHLLLLLSNAIPKCLASALTSLFIELSLKEYASESLPALILETLRLHPPLLGGMRRTGESAASIGESEIPKRHRVWYSTLHANRDAQVYSHAHSFRPERWNSLQADVCPFGYGTKHSSKPPLPLSFGAGERACHGRELAWMILMTVAEAITDRLQVVKDMHNTGMEMRHLPVRKPVQDVRVVMRKR